MCVNNMVTTYSKWKINGWEYEGVEQYHALGGQGLVERLVLEWGSDQSCVILEWF